ncbi:MAG: universal stress protein [Variovorax paradoxus]|jgi:nucleotide-binding universal stress UspA family protein|nr:MAG: universal stress protein [Variovorax paradoxus]PZQ04450.1 MAG: universal stress protein [Variovorax paradoxus]
MSTFTRILVPLDGSETSKAALTTALQLARDTGAQLRLVHCLDELAYFGGYEYSSALIDQARKDADRLLAEGQDMCRAANIDASTHMIERFGQRLGQSVSDEAAQWRADLIVVGTHGRRGMGRVLLGSGAEQIIRFSKVPVLTIRGRETDTGD